jgi:hypothetical protein
MNWNKLFDAYFLLLDIFLFSCSILLFIISKVNHYSNSNPVMIYSGIGLLGSWLSLHNVGHDRGDL